MRGTEILLLIAVAVLIFYIVLREPTQTIILLVPFEKQPNLENRNAMVPTDPQVVPKYHGFATA